MLTTYKLTLTFNAEPMRDLAVMNNETVFGLTVGSLYYI